MDISKIVFHRSNSGKISTLVFFDDGRIENFSYEDGVELLLEYAHKQGYTRISELQNDENLKIWNNNEYLKNVKQMINEHQNKFEDQNDEDAEIEPEYEHELERKRRGLFKFLPHPFRRIKNAIFNRKRKEKKNKKSRKNIIVNGLIGLCIAAGVGASAWIKKDLNRKEHNIQKDLDKNSDSKKKNSKKTSDTYTQVNADKNNAVNAVWDYISGYNMGANYQSDKNSSTKLGLRWDEVVAEYLAYNNLSQKAINNIFDTYKFDAHKFVKAYKSGFEQEVLSCVVQTNASEKAALIKNNKGKDFYNKYESMLLDYNNAKDGKQKVKYAEKFYKQLHKDFDDDFTQYYVSDIAKYKLSIMPMIKAMNKMTSKLELNNELTAYEKDCFDRLSDSSVIETKFKNIEKKLTAYQIANKSLGDNDDEISYAQLKKRYINELKDDDAYNVADNSDRNIKDHSEYKKNISYKYIPNNSGNDNSSKKENNNQTTKEVNTTDDNSVQKTPETKKESKEKQERKAVHETKKTDDKIKTSTSDSKNKKSNKSTSSDSSNKESVAVEEGATGATTSVDTTTVEDNIVTPSSDNYQDTSSAIKADDNGTNNVEIDDSVKDVTTDSTGAVDSDTALPDPNSDVDSGVSGSREDNDSLITITYINPDSLDTSSNYQISEDNEMTGESVATQNTSDEIVNDETSVDEPVKTYTK